MDNNIYLDHNATSPLLPEAQTAMNNASGRSIGNPSSPHWAGRDAKILLEESRESLAKSLGAEPREIIFTSGGSESNNAVLRQLILASGE
ncbi:MAG: aminotransferase V, partial [Anaerolineaceae bacterium]|nr:aminotransferase V [Anaerolineaceae bacterium]